MKGPGTSTAVCLLALLVLSGCAASSLPRPGVSASQPCSIALAPLGGEDPLDRKILELQGKAREGSDPRVLEQLAHHLVARGRMSSDAGFYKIAEQCALCLESKDPSNSEALLVRGHVLHQLHLFKEAEVIGRQLVNQRRNVLDYGLLGDALMEQGKLEEATQAYQQMVDIKPFFQSYVRAAHMRWLKGDLSGALQLMTAAIDSAGTRDKESVAWAYSRLALYQLQAGRAGQAMRSSEAALGYQSRYAPALLVRGRALMSQGHFAPAAECLKIAAGELPLPEYQWALLEALRAAGRVNEATAVEARMLATGTANDPRTFAVYLASQKEQISKALDLTQRELNVRNDVFTLDAAAWSLATSGRTEEARSMMRRALAEGTADARLFYHAGVIADAAGCRREARQWIDKASAIQQMLLPSEKERLLQLKNRLNRG